MQLSYKDIKTINGDFGKEKQEALKFLIEYGEQLNADNLVDLYNIGPMFCNKKYISDPYASIIINQPTFNEKCIRKDFFSVVFLNSVIGANVNQESIQVINAVSKTNKIPFYGFFKEENCSKKIMVNIHTKLIDDFDFDILGFYLNKNIISEVPIIAKVNTHMTFKKYKYICSALNISKNIKKFHILNKTPNSHLRVSDENYGKINAIHFYEEDKVKIINTLTTAKDKKVDLIIVGSPYVSISEVKIIINYFNHNKLHQSVKLFLKMSYFLYFTLQTFGLIKELNRIGCDYIFDFETLTPIFKDQKVNNIATNSSFNAYIINEQYSKRTYYGSLKECINTASSGYWNK